MNFFILYIGTYTVLGFLVLNTMLTNQNGFSGQAGQSEERSDGLADQSQSHK